MAKDYNNEQQSVQVTVRVNGIETKFISPHTYSNQVMLEFINKYSIQNKANFKIESLNYDENTGKINKVTLKKIT